MKFNAVSVARPRQESNQGAVVMNLLKVNGQAIMGKFWEC